MILLRNAMKETSIVKEEIYKGKMFSVEKHLVMLDDGSEDTRELVKNGGGAGIVAIDTENNIILVRQYRFGSQRVMLEIPAGKLSANESHRDCAIRELQEETGYIAESAELLLEYYASPAYLTEKVEIYYACRVESGSAHPDPGEFVEVVKMPFAEAYDMVMKGEIKDGKTQMAVMKLALEYKQKNR